MVKLSVVMPVYNEVRTVSEIVERVLQVAVDKELIVVDDRSVDGSFARLEDLAARHGEIRLHRHPRNLGKGAALRTGFGLVQGGYVVIQDADLEYDPADYLRMLVPLEEGVADVVYGSRFLEGDRQRFLLSNWLANRFLTALSNSLSGLHLTDMETCYKMFRSELLGRFTLQSDRFEIEPELTATFARLKVRLAEVPVSYQARTHRGGKKIGFADGLTAVRAIIQHNCFPRRVDPGRRSDHERP